MNVLLNGTCSSRGPGSWPYYLNCNLVNLSLSGAGNAYIHDTTIAELAKRSYDVVVVMWGESQHCSIKVDDITKFADSKNTSLYQSSLNDWAGKVSYPVDDRTYVDKNWILNAGYLNNMNDSVSKFFKEYHKHITHSQILEADITRMISLQGVLKTLKQPYLFLYGRPFKKLKRFDHLYNLIDWDNFYIADSLMEIADRTNDHEVDNKYPGQAGQQYYAGLIDAQIKLAKF